MPARRTKADVLDRDFLETRGRLLDLAAALDRLDDAPGAATDAADPRLDQLRRGIETLLKPGPDRAQAVQTIFSREYDPDWHEHLKVKALRPGR